MITREVLTNALLNYDPSRLYLTPHGLIFLEEGEAGYKTSFGYLFSSSTKDRLDYNQPLPGVDRTPLYCVVSKVNLMVTEETVSHWFDRDSVSHYTSVLSALLSSSEINLDESHNRLAISHLLFKIRDYINNPPAFLFDPSSPFFERGKEYNRRVLSWLTCLHNNLTLPRDELYEKIRVLMYSVKYSRCQDDSLFSDLTLFADDPLDEASQLHLELHALVGLAADELNPKKVAHYAKSIKALRDAGADPSVKVKGRSALSLIHLESSRSVVVALFERGSTFRALDLSEPTVLRNVLYFCVASNDSSAEFFLVKLGYEQQGTYYSFIQPALSDQLFSYQRGASPLGRHVYFFMQAVLDEGSRVKHKKMQGSPDLKRGIMAGDYQGRRYSDVTLMDSLKAVMCARVLRRDGLMSLETSPDKVFNVREQGCLQQAVRDQYVLGDQPFLLDNILRTNSKRTTLKDTETFKKVRDYLKGWPISRTVLVQLKHRALNEQAPVSPRDAVLYYAFADDVFDAEFTAIVTKHLVQPVPEAALIALNRALNLLSEEMIKAIKERLVAISKVFIGTDLTQALQLTNPASPFIEVLKTSGSGKRNQNTTTYTAWVKDFDAAVQQASVGVVKVEQPSSQSAAKRFTFSLIPSILFGPKKAALPQDQKSGLLPSLGFRADDEHL